MKRHSSRQVDDDIQPIAFAKKHRFKDTLALFIVFLSFNHFASLCLLISFVLATRFRNFLTNSFIALFLSKKPSPPMAEVSHVDDNRDIQYTANSNDKKQTALPSWRTRHNFSLPLLISEMVVATILKLYGENYFLKPIENLALSILASSLINDPKDCLSYATSCSVLYAVALHLYQKVGLLQRLGGSSSSSDLAFPISLLKSAVSQNEGTAAASSMARSQLMSWVNRYGRHLLYYISFHIVVFQFSVSTLSHHSDDEKQTNTKKAVTAKGEPKGSGQRVSSLGSVKSSLENPNVNSTTQNQQQSITERLSSNSTNQDSSGLAAFPNSGLNYGKKGNKGQQRLPYFTGVVNQYEAFEASLTYEGGDNAQTMATNVTIPSPSSSQGSDKVGTTYTNQFYDIKVEFGTKKETRNLKLDVTVTSNLENFIRHLFKRKNQHLIPPLWSIVVTLKTTNFEKRYLKESKEITLTPSNSGTAASENDSSDGIITPTNSNGNGSDEQAAESVFNKLQSSGNMALIAQTAFDDYAQLHLVSTNDNIFKKDDKDYKVCIVEIASNSITFHIENLHEGELIVLVNGVIWSEVSCALILEHEGEELVVVGGLVPSCPYDIQFINRLRQMEDYLISDLMVRTVGSKDTTEKFETIDISFPSYYHRKFLSPLLTLKHSVLTTNTNLAEGRVKLKKTKKEVSKKLNGLRQDIDHYKTKISQNATNDEKNASKVESLKTAHQQSEATLCKLEDQLKTLTDEEFKLEEEYLRQKDSHLRRQMEYGKLEDSFTKSLKEAEAKRSKLQQELNQLNSKKEKLFAKRERLQREVNQNTVECENLKSQFLSKKEKERVKRSELRAREANELEMIIKGLEQDISRLEGENGNLRKVARGM